MSYTMETSVAGDFDHAGELAVDALDSIVTDVRNRLERVLSTVGNGTR
ncbi:hypothetical protein [Haloarcula rara]|nr:hypothetical protein [Halomicroarcula sp. SHR3]